MAPKKRGLGKGLDSLIPGGVKVNSTKPGKSALVDEKDIIIKVDINKVEPDRNQPRTAFNEDKLNELADSIREHGIVEPLIVQKKEDYYEIVAGERRWRAAKLADLKEVPIIVKEFVTEQEKVTIQLIENIQREDLNPIDEAMSYRRLIEEFGMKQDEVADTVGKNRTTISNSMRLLNLADEVQKMLIDEMLSPGHARALLGVADKSQQAEIANKVFDEKMSVRETEKYVKSLSKPRRKKKLTPEALQLIYRQLEDKIREQVGAKVTIKATDEKKGKIEIEYFSQDELESIVEKISKGDK